MFRHRPSCLEGPVSHTLGPWSGENTDSDRCRNQSGSRAASPDIASIRTELVERIRGAIAEGRYETPEKWEAALELLFQRLHDS
jgi:hypothetical protein